ncbi:MAG: hypothetical protein NZ455_13345 [Bacteroidia bacterium]|nr:hypothetical protein [Bacteroidia bacterium]
MRSAAKHRSERVVRSSPTRAPARDTPKKVKLFFRLYIFLRLITKIRPNDTIYYRQPPPKALYK